MLNHNHPQDLPSWENPKKPPEVKKASALSSKSDVLLQRFLIEAVFLRQIIKTLTRDADEQMHFLTGPMLDGTRIVSRWAKPVELEEQSPTFVRASAGSVGGVCISIIEQGAELHVIAHSHPGNGIGATTPSGTDTKCLGKLQKNRSQAIGCIVTRDNHVRFFSVSVDFHVTVVGTGVTEIDKYVFHIAPENSH